MSQDQSPDMAHWLRSVLDVEAVEENFFRGIATPKGRGRSFGGQVVGQALMAAIRTAPEDKSAHSLHAYFMRPGDATKPVLYRVERDMDGRSFATRRVIAIQNGQPILNLAASFHRKEDGYFQQTDMPDVPMPEELENEIQLAERYGDQLPPAAKAFFSSPKPIEMRGVALRPPFTRDPSKPEQNFWFKLRGSFADDPGLNRAGLAYTTDFGLLGTSVLPWAKAFMDPDMQFASLDHAVWFHDEFKMDEWLLYSTYSPWTGGARGFNRGRVFTRDGRLVASTAQEGLVRPITPGT